MKNTIKIQQMQRGDLKQIQHLYKDLIEDTVPMELLERQYDRTWKRPEYALLVAKEGNVVCGSSIGIICQALDAPFLVVENVVVDARYRQKGIGRKIFQALDEFALANDCQYALLVSSGFRKKAHCFYEAMGYVDDVRGFRKYYR